MNETLSKLDNQIKTLEKENNLRNESNEKIIKEKVATEKFSSIPNMMRCYICEGNKYYI